MAPAARKLQKPIKLRRSYKLKSVEGDLATISLKTSVVTPIKAPQVRGQLVQRKPAGTIVFDIKRGVVVSREQKIDAIELGVYGNESSIRVVSSNNEKLVENTDVAAKSD